MDITKKILIILTAICIFVIFSFISSNPNLTDTNKSIYFGEFVQSTDFSILLNDFTHSFSYRTGTYNLGLPISHQKESVFGTQRGTRALPFVLLVSTLQTIFGILWDRVFLVLTLIGPLFGFYVANKFFGISKNSFGIFFGSLLFAFNPWIFSRIQTGFWQLHFAYAAIPFFYLSFISLWNFEQEKPKSFPSYRKIIHITGGIISASIIYSYQPHFILMLTIPLGFIFVYNVLTQPLKKTFNAILIALTMIIGTIFVNAYHILPSLIHRTYFITLPGQDLTLAAVNFNGQGSRIIDVLKLTPINPLQFHEYVFTNIDYLGYGFLISFLLYLLGSLVSARKINRNIITSLIYILFITIFIFLAKGINEPFIDLSKNIYSSVLMRPFRDPSRFYSMIVFFSSMTIATVTIQSLKIKNLYTLFFLVWFIPTVYIYSDHSAKSIALEKIPATRYSSFDSQHSPSRVLFFPQNVPLSYFNWQKSHSTGTSNDPTDAIIPLQRNKATYSGHMDTYFNQLNWYTSQRLINNKPYKHLLSKMGVNSIIIDSDVKEDIPDIHYLKVLPEIMQRDGYKIIQKHENVMLLSQDESPPFIIDKQPIFVSGDLETFDQVSQKADGIPLILLNQPTNIQEFIDKNVKNQKIIYDSETQLRLLFLENLKNYSLNLDSVVWDNEEPWSLHEVGLHADIADGQLYTSGKSIEPKEPNSLLRFSRVLNPDIYTIAIRSHIPGIQSELRIKIEDKEYILNHDSNDRFVWKILGQQEISGSTQIEILSKGTKDSIIDEILLIPSETFSKEEKNYFQLLSQNNLIPLDNFELTYNDKTSSIETSRNDYHIWKVDSSSEWISIKMLYENGWTITDQKAKFVGDYYGMTFLSSNVQSKEIKYEPEETFSYYLKLSKIATIVFLILLFIAIKKEYDL